MIPDRDMTPPDGYSFRDPFPLTDDDRVSEAEQEQYWFLVDQEMEKIIAAEGVLTVNGRYFADHKDAQMVRQVEAESRVREAARAREIRLRSEIRRAS